MTLMFSKNSRLGHRSSIASASKIGGISARSNDMVILSKRQVPDTINNMYTIEERQHNTRQDFLKGSIAVYEWVNRLVDSEEGSN